MLLTPDHARQKFKRERLIIAVGLILLSLFLIQLFWQTDPNVTPSTPERIACDAERTRGEYFYNGDFNFEGAAYRSIDQARSGRFSLGFPADGETHYGFSIVLDQVAAGDVYEITVWSYGNNAGEAKLAIQGRKPSGLYQESADVISTDQMGWQLHRLRFHIPFQSSPSRLAVYVYSHGQEAVFFDDLMIKKIDLWEESSFRPTRLVLDVAPTEWQKLVDKRNTALQVGILQTGTNDWAEANMQTGDSQEMQAKIRLKGDWLDHLQGDKWSFRVNLKNEFSWRGMQTFSLHTPAARHYLHEWLLHKYWKELDVLTTRYDFVELVVNGKSLGIYAYEEHFEKQLIESQQRREGPILKLSEAGFWAGIARQLQHHGFVRPGSGYRTESMLLAPIEAFDDDLANADPIQKGYLAQASQLLEQFRAGQLTAGQVFDLELMARYYAACDLLNAYHGIVWHNQRFYYNPVTNLLEPIGFDGFSEDIKERYHFLGEGSQRPDHQLVQSFFPYLMQDTAFVKRYVKQLKDLSERDHFQIFLNRTAEEASARLDWLQMEFPNYIFLEANLQSELAFVRSHLLPIEEQSLIAYRQTKQTVAIHNQHTLPLELVGYGASGRYMSGTLDSTLWIPAAATPKIAGIVDVKAGQATFAEFNFLDQQTRVTQLPAKPSIVSLPQEAKYLYFRLPATDSLLQTAIRPAHSTAAIVDADFRKPSKASDFPQFHWLHSQKQVAIPAGQHQLSKALILPKGYTLIISAGAKIDLTANSYILSYGPVQASGEAEQLIQFYSSDNSGQGLIVLNSERASQLRYVDFDNLSALKAGNWQLTGAVTFHQSAVVLEQCSFRNNNSEDALNVIRSTIDINACRFQQTSSDALDSDFCKGTISRCHFKETVNDGLDLSGSFITVSDCTFDLCGDKGISVGEASEIVVEDCVISNASIGLASKDRSVLLGRRLEVTKCEQGMVVFQKKPEYGPAIMLLENLNTTDVKRLYQIGPGSRLQIDDKTYE